MAENNCLICDRIASIERGENPFFVGETETGYIVIGDHQFFRGYTLLLSKHHERELHDLPDDVRRQFLWEMSEVAGAVFRAFQPVKLNYELLGNTDVHMHWHLIPRYASDPLPLGPAWRIDPEIRNSVRPSPAELEQLKMELRAQLPAGLILHTR